MLSCIWLFVIPWTVARQAPLSMGFSSQEYWRGLSFPSPGGLTYPKIRPVFSVSPALAGRFSTAEPPGNPHIDIYTYIHMHMHAYKYIWEIENRIIVVLSGELKEEIGPSQGRAREESIVMSPGWGVFLAQCLTWWIEQFFFSSLNYFLMWVGRQPIQERVTWV